MFLELRVLLYLHFCDSLRKLSIIGIHPILCWEQKNIFLKDRCYHGTVYTNTHEQTGRIWLRNCYKEHNSLFHKRQ